MQIAFGDRTYPFEPWRPEMGRALSPIFSFCSGTTAVNEAYPWLTPAYVIGAAFDGKRGLFIRRDRLNEFFEAHADPKIVFHGAALELDAIATASESAALYDRVDAGRVFDTQLMHRLLVLGEEGGAAKVKAESTLKRCAATYLGEALPAGPAAASGNAERLSYEKWLGRPTREIEPDYLEALAVNAVATSLVFAEIRTRTRGLFATSGGIWGFVSLPWLQDRIDRFGYQTHHIQLKAAIVLRAITANGLHLDVGRKTELEKSLRALVSERKLELRDYGYLAGEKGCDASLQAVLKIRARRGPDLRFPRTADGRFDARNDALRDLADADPFVMGLLEYREAEHLLKSFVGKLEKSVLHPSFDPLVRSGRTSSSGDINAQNVPRCDRVRSCFIPSPGREFIDADYAAIEMAALAQACHAQFGLDSAMAKEINAGGDLHTLVAAKMLGKPAGDVTPDERRKAKPINFGTPGGMGSITLAAHAKTDYGVTLSPEEVEGWSKAWFDLFPEMGKFLAAGRDTAAELAELLDLTPASHHASTGDGRFLRHRANAGLEECPNAILGRMLLKVATVVHPSIGKGVPYSAGDLEYFWTKLAECSDRFPPAQREAVRARRPSPALRLAVCELVELAPVYTLTGRIRAGANYRARHNTVFQGLAADGAKLALWRLWRDGFRIVNFIHDQVLIEIPASTPVERMVYARRIRDHMIEGMNEVVPDIRIDVHFAASARWYTDAEAVVGPEGDELQLWFPPSAG